MKNIHPLDAELRKQKRLREFASKNPYCLLCGLKNPMLLRPVTRKFLEDHHVFLEVNHPDCILALCFNCHALAHEGYHAMSEPGSQHAVFA